MAKMIRSLKEGADCVAKLSVTHQYQKKGKDMIKEKLKKLGCFVLAASMLLCNQMPVFADNLLGHITIKSDQTVNLQECNNVNLKLTVSIGSKDVTFTNGDSFEAAAGSDNAKALGAIKYYTDNAANDSDFVSHFSVDSTKSSENNAVIFKLLANESDSISPLDMSTVTSGSNYYLGTGTNLNNFEKSFCIKKTGSTYRFYFGSAAVLNSFLVKDKAYYVDENSNVQPVSQYTDTFDFNDISAEITEDSPYPNVSMKFVSTMPSSYDMSGLKYDVVFRASGNKVVFAFPSVTYVEDIKNSLINVNDYDLTYYSDTDVTPTEAGSLKAGSILKKNVSYLISNFNTGSEVASTNKKYNRDNIAFYDADTNGCLETTGKKLSSGTPVASTFTPKKTYKVVSVKREMLGDFDYCYTVMLKHEHVETTATNKVADPTCTAKGVNELITTCSDCGDEVRHEIQYVNALGHNAGTPTKENVIPSTCTEGGSYQEITRCTRCNEILKSELKTTPALGHNFGAWTKVDNVTADVIDNALNKALFDGQAVPASLEKRACATCGGYELIPDEIHEHSNYVTINENVIDATCSSEGGYDVVTRCGTCNEEISRTHIVTEKIAHTPAKSVIENEVKATCTADGSYDEVVKCSVCGEELSRTARTTKALGHVNETTVKENVVNPSCETEGGYDEVIYCERDEDGCNHSKLSSTHVTVPATGHVNKSARVDKVKEPTCTENGLYKAVVFCTDCNKDLTSKDIVIPATGHTAGEITVENNVAPTCTTGGSYDEVVRCTTCNDVISRNAVKVAALGHAAGEPVIENMVKPTEKKEGGYDVVVYCTRDDHGCGHKELSRKHVVLDKLEHKHVAGTPVIENKTAATCDTNGGYDINVYCTDCKKLISSTHETVPALGHNYELTKTVDATCTKDGYNLYTCKNDASHTKKDVIKATGHNYIHQTDSYSAPTCTADGKYREFDQCADCGDVKNEKWHTVEALGHTFGAWTEITDKAQLTKELFADAVNASELNFADLREYDHVYRSNCARNDGYKLRVDKHEHSDLVTVKENVVDATCTKTGSFDEVVKCGVCGDVVSRDKITVSAKGHIAGEPVVENMVEPTEKKEGSYDIVVYCTRDEDGCNHSEISRKHVVLDKLEHKHTAGAPVIKHVTEPTCTNSGTYYANIYCTDCGELLDYTVINLPGLGHMYPQDEWIKVSSSHITKDFFDKAENAKELEKKTPFESIDKKHDLVYTVKCYRCDSYVVKVIKHVHTAGAPVISETKKATCTEKGMITSTTSCTKCRKTLESTTIEIPALGHIAGEPVIENKVDPTTEKEGGYDIVVYCTREHNGCGHKELSRKHVVIDKLKHEHTVGEPVIEVVKAATCENKGSVKVTVSCTDCGEVLSSVTKDIPALGHNYELTKTVDATCTENGYVLYTCKNDAEHTEKTVVKATGHEYSDPVVENKNDLKHDEVIYCAKCGEELSRKTVIDAQPETKPDAVLPETKPKEAAPAETVETPVETVVETPATEQASETDTETAALVTNDTSDTMTYTYVMLLGAAAVCATAVLRRKKTDIEE